MFTTPIFPTPDIPLQSSTSDQYYGSLITPKNIYDRGINTERSRGIAY